MIYDAVWYNGGIDQPGYFLVEPVEGDTPEEALLNNLDALTEQVRDMFFLDDWTDRRIQETLYVLRDDAVVSLYSIHRTQIS